MEALSASTSAADVNIVTNPNYTEADRRVAMLTDASRARGYLQDNFSKPDALFLISLEHHEGEFAIGLGTRTFNAARDSDLDPAADSLLTQPDARVEIKWFERKNKRSNDWGQQPGFKPCIGAYDERRRPVIVTSVERVSRFLPIAVKLTPASKKDHPVLSKDCMSAIRLHVSKDGTETAEDAWSVVSSDSDEQPVPRKRLRKNPARVDDDD